MQKLIYTALFFSFIFLTSNISAQQQRGLCGTMDESLADRVSYNREHYSSQLRDGEKVFIPIIFHSSAKDNGKGRVANSGIIKTMQRLNNDYDLSNADIIFYIDTINKIDNSDVYLSSGGSIGKNKMKIEKNAKGKNAMNVFITENADHNGNSLGVTLGYYSPTDDWVVIRKQEILSQSNTLSHEGGHFYSLPHTFFGWEFGDGKPYDPETLGDTVSLTYCPGTSMEIELVARTGDHVNCSYSADRFCDTPADWNFGFGHNCAYIFDAVDKYGDACDPMVNNQMSYFSDCDEFLFTPEQITAVKSDVASPNRAYLRHEFVPDTTKIVDTIKLISDWVTTLDTNGFYHPEHFDEVTIEWDPVEGASRYVLDIAGPGGVNESIIFYNGETSYTITSLKKEGRYNCFLKPFNKGFYNSPDLSFKIKANKSGVAVEDIAGVNNFNITPNPVSSNSQFFINIDTDRIFNSSISVISLTGQLLWTKNNYKMNVGENTISLNTSDFAKGLYFVNIKTPTGQMTEKLIIQ